MTPIYTPTQIPSAKGFETFVRTTKSSQGYTLTCPVFLNDAELNIFLNPIRRKPLVRWFEAQITFEGPITCISFSEITELDGVRERTPLVIRHLTDSVDVKLALEKPLALLHAYRAEYPKSEYIDGASATMVWLMWTLAHHLPSLCQFSDRPKSTHPTVSIVTESADKRLGYWKGCFLTPAFTLPYLDQSNVKYFVSVVPRSIQVLSMGKDVSNAFPIMYRSWVMLYLKLIYSDRPYLTLRHDISAVIDPISDRPQTPISFRYKGSIYKLGVVGGNLAVIELNARNPRNRREETINIFTIPTEG